MENIKKILKLFLEDLDMEDMTHLKYVLPDKDIEKFIEDWIKDNAFNLLVSSTPVIQGKIESNDKNNDKNKVSGKTIELKKTYYLKVTVEDEEMRADEDNSSRLFSSKEDAAKFINSLLIGLIDKNGLY